MLTFTVNELAAAVGGKVIGDGELIIRGIKGIAEAGPAEITFLANPKYKPALASTRAAAIIAGEGVAAEAKGVNPQLTFIEVKKPYVAFAKVLGMFTPPRQFPRGISPLAVVAPNARLGADVAVGPYAVLEEGVVVGDGTVIGPGVFIGKDSTIGAGCLIYANVSIREGVKIGDRCIIHHGAVIGSDGFGFATDDGVHIKIPQVGGVIIEDDVEVGANTTIDRGTMGDTRIGRGTKIDNLVQIAHNVQIGEGTLIAAQTGIAGSTVVGKYCVFGGQVGVVGHITIGDHAVLAAQAGVSKSVPAGETYFGYPARPIMEVKKNEARISLLEKLYARVKKLESEVERLKGEKGV